MILSSRGSKASVRLRNGTMLEDERPVPYRHLEDPMSDGGMEAKFELLASVLASDPTRCSCVPLGSHVRLRSHRALMDACWGLESMGDVSELLGMIRLNLGKPA